MAKYPAVQDPKATIDSLHQSVTQLKEAIEILTQQRGARGDAAVTWEELENYRNTSLQDALTTLAEDSNEYATAAVTEAIDAFAGEYETLAAYNLAVTASYQGYADTAAGNAQAAAEAKAATELAAFAGLYSSMANYNVIVTASYEGYADAAADAAQAAAEATAGAALTAFASGYASMAAYETYVSSTYTSLTYLTTNYATASTIAGTYATKANAYAYHTLKLDVNGYVSGTTSTNDGDVADITFITDNMRVAKPGSVTPVAFLETGLNASGATTVVLKADRIKVSSIDTENIITEAATAVWSETDADVNPATLGTELAAITVDVVVGTVDVYFEAELIFQRDDTSASNHVELGLYLDAAGTPLFSRVYPCVVSSGAKIRTVAVFSRVLTGLSVGSHTIKVKLYNTTFDTNTSGRTRIVNDPFLRVLESRR